MTYLYSNHPPLRPEDLEDVPLEDDPPLLVPPKDLVGELVRGLVVLVLGLVVFVLGLVVLVLGLVVFVLGLVVELVLGLVVFVLGLVVELVLGLVTVLGLTFVLPLFILLLPFRTDEFLNKDPLLPAL